MICSYPSVCPPPLLATHLFPCFLYALQVFYNVGKVKSDKGQKDIAEAAYRRAITSVILLLYACNYIGAFAGFIQNMINP